MKKVFADTSYWIAVFHPQDEHRGKATIISETIAQLYIVTSEMVLVEFLNYFAKLGPDFRLRASKFVHDIMNNSNIKIIAQTPNQFLEALSLYDNRPDKKWSLTDCASINIITREGITEVLTTDAHFQQAGFIALLK